jgi:hypothetical protein
MLSCVTRARRTPRCVALPVWHTAGDCAACVRACVRACGPRPSFPLHTRPHTPHHAQVVLLGLNPETRIRPVVDYLAARGVEPGALPQLLLQHPRIFEYKVAGCGGGGCCALRVALGLCFGGGGGVWGRRGGPDALRRAQPPPPAAPPAPARPHSGAPPPPPPPPPPHTHTTHATHTTPPRARATHTHTPRARRAGVPRGRHPDQGRCAHPGGRAAPAKRHQGDRRQLLQVGRGVLRRRAWRAACGARARTHARVGLGAERGTSRAVGDGQLWRLALWCCGSCCCLTRCLPPAAHARTPHNTHHAHHTHHTPRTPHTPHTRTNTQWLQSPVSPLPPTQLPA